MLTRQTTSEKHGRRSTRQPVSRKTRNRICGVKIGILIDLDSGGMPVIDFPDNPHGHLAAQSTIVLTEKEIGRQVALQFEDGDSRRPLILGVMQDTPVDSPSGRPKSATVDGETITFDAEKEIVMRCGKAAIMLSRDGRVTIRGTYLLSRSSGVNRIQGGSIQLN